MRSPMALALLLGALLLAGGCTLGPVWAQRVEGRVVDAETGRPVPGAAVRVYHQLTGTSTHGGGGWLAVRRTRTDAEGRFVVRGRFNAGYRGGRTDAEPSVVAVHPEYGADYTQAGTDADERLHVEIRLHWDFREIEELLDPRESCRPTCGESLWWSCLGDTACVERRARRP